ncbi:hypothetical protein AGOR_G00116920 [Albula goreensis]|uniref:Group XIIB secretory phospholipase A2-like protein n=1 Tax=Albula goreensis TaxID=1534307 RepID=A0A8T3DHU3_9TELE|nr:hypothetical protein AGOR_G00116920 [Albula goreensis]
MALCIRVWLLLLLCFSLCAGAALTNHREEVPAAEPAAPALTQEEEVPAAEPAAPALTQEEEVPAAEPAAPALTLEEEVPAAEPAAPALTQEEEVPAAEPAAPALTQEEEVPAAESAAPALTQEEGIPAAEPAAPALTQEEEVPAVESAAPARTQEEEVPAAEPAAEPAGTTASPEPDATQEASDSQPDPNAALEPSATPLPAAAQTEAQDSDWGLNFIRDSFQSVNSYFDSVVELMGGRNGVCQYRCRYGKAPHARPNYKMPEPNGCSSSLLGFQVPESLDMGIPAMTKCCNQLDLCYDTCGSNKYRCDSKFRWCLHGICSDLKRSLGFVSKVEACESVADTLYNTVWTLGCRSFMNSQRAACFCEGEERDEL